MTQGTKKRTIDNQQFIISHFSLLTSSLVRFFSLVTLLSFSKKVSPYTPRDNGGSSLSSKESEEIYAMKNQDEIQNEWAVLETERKKGLVSAEVSRDIKYFIEKKDEIQQGIIAERALRKLEEKSLTLLHDMILNPQLYPHISNNEEKNSLLEDWLFTHEHFSYCFLQRTPAFWEVLMDSIAFSQRNIIHHYFSSDEREKEAQRANVLHYIEQQLSAMNDRSELYSDLTSESDCGVEIVCSGSSGSPISSEKPYSKNSNLSASEQFMAEIRTSFLKPTLTRDKVVRLQQDNDDEARGEGDGGIEGIGHYSNHS